MVPLNIFSPKFSATQLEQEASLNRKARLLRSLVITLIGFHLLALIEMSTPPPQFADLYSYFAVLISLEFNILILYLSKRGHLKLASYLFCIFLNVIIFITFLINAALLKNDIQASSFGHMLAINILISGMLIGSGSAIWSTLANSALVVLVLFNFSNGASVADVRAISLPILVFLSLVALITWFYQRTLDQAIDNLAIARKEAADARVAQRELEIARELQQSLFPPPPQIGPIQFAVWCEPEQQTGGDFYDFIDLGPDHLGIVVADAAGKGMSAALVMMSTRSILRHGARLNLSPGEVMTQTNQTAFRDGTVDKMVTAFYGVLNTKTLELRFANAGHPFPILKRNGTVKSLDAPGFPLRAVPEAAYKTHTYQLQPGDQLIWISDGIIEAHSPSKVLFGFDRLESLIDQTHNFSATNLLNYIYQAVLTHQAEAEQIDDMTIVIADILRHHPAMAADSEQTQLPTT